MIDQITTLEDGEIALPTASLDLSTRMRDLRARQGLKQSEVARRMRLDPSIPSLWEQGKRLVPANRVRARDEGLAGRGGGEPIAFAPWPTPSKSASRSCSTGFRAPSEPLGRRRWRSRVRRARASAT